MRINDGGGARTLCNESMCCFYMDTLVVKKVTSENSFDAGLSVFSGSLFGVFSKHPIVFNLVLLQGCDVIIPKHNRVCVMIHS